MVSYLHSCALYLTISTLVAVTFAVPAFSLSPTSETIAKCYANESIPKHFAQATDVIAAEFQMNTADESLGIYRIRKVWKGSKKEGSILRFQLPCYGRDYLMKIGTNYLFFLKPTSETIQQSDPVYTTSSCYRVKPIPDEIWGADYPDPLIKILDAQSTNNKERQ